MPTPLEEEEVMVLGSAARNLIQEEGDRTRAGFNMLLDPGRRVSSFEAMDLDGLRRRYPFLNDFSDAFIKSTPVEVLFKAELSARKLQDLEKSKKAEERLFANRNTLASSVFHVEAGTDNRLDRLHQARCMPGATCTAAKLWLHAREVMGEGGHVPLATYDMASIGLGGCVTPKGWVALHDPATPDISIKMFSMGNCSSKSKEARDSEFPEMEDLVEFKTALRVLRGAMVCVHPWNRSIDALESFLVQSNYCSADLSGVEKQVNILTQFTDYVLAENASRWRGLEPFLTTRDLRGAWADFIAQKSTLLSQKTQASNKSSSSYYDYKRKDYRQKESSSNSGSGKAYRVDSTMFFDDICVMWNIGKCVKAPGQCMTRKGAKLKHVCNYKPDPNNPRVSCGKDHAALFYHK